jgi:hypothetical protein
LDALLCLVKAYSCSVSAPANSHGRVTLAVNACRFGLLQCKYKVAVLFAGVVYIRSSAVACLRGGGGGQCAVDVLTSETFTRLPLCCPG